MRKSTFNESQIVGILKDAEAGVPVNDLLAFEILRGADTTVRLIKDRFEDAVLVICSRPQQPPKNFGRPKVKKRKAAKACGLLQKART